MAEENDSHLPEESHLRDNGVEPYPKEKDSHKCHSSQIPGRLQAGRRQNFKGKSLAASAVFAAVLAGVSGILPFSVAQGWISALCHAAWIVFVGGIGFLIMYTGRISRWRAVFFAVLAWGFILSFKAALIGLRGSAFFSPDIQEVPYCHIAIASSILNYAYQQYLAFQSGNFGLWGPLSLGFLWLAVTLAIGQAWCSWGCFYGGLDDSFSRLARKPILAWYRLPAKLRNLPAILLVFMILMSLSSMLPVFCLWVCPLKISTAFLDVNTNVRMLQLVIFTVGGISTIILLPILTKKRVFCGLICPFGAWQSFFGRINPFRVAISSDKCNMCKLCLKVCPTFVLDQKSLETHTVSPYCNLCGECIDACPTGAISYTLLGREIKPNGEGSPSPKAEGSLTGALRSTRRVFQELVDGRVMFVFAALLVGGAVGGIFVPQVAARLFEAISR